MLFLGKDMGSLGFIVALYRFAQDICLLLIGEFRNIYMSIVKNNAR